MEKIKIYRWNIFVLLIIILTTIKHVINLLIPDVPKSISDLIKRQEYINSKIESKKLFQKVRNIIYMLNFVS